MTASCPREQEAVHAVMLNRWPDGSAPDLAAHVAGCPVCDEVVSVASMLRDDREGASRLVQVPAASQVWWRAAVRARIDAAHAARRPLTWLDGIAGASAAGLVAAAGTLAWPMLQAAARRAIELATSMHPEAYSLAQRFDATLQWGVPLLLTAAACAVLAPIAVYLASSDEP